MVEKLKPCAACGCPDAYLDSSATADAIWIECALCDNQVRGRVAVEELAEQWNAMDRSAMPEFKDD